MEQTMSNVTLAINDALLKEARIKALKDGTSVNEICRRAVEQYVGRESAAANDGFLRHQCHRLCP
jgi:predicted HicB family RNase H-like nuclease